MAVSSRVARSGGRPESLKAMGKQVAILRTRADAGLLAADKAVLTCRCSVQVSQTIHAGADEAQSSREKGVSEI